MRLESYLNPSMARSFANGTHERELASCALRNLWHIVFDPCPSLLQLASPDGKTIMEPFLVWAEDKNLTMSWSMHIHLLNWMEHTQSHGIKIADETKRELVVASAIRWAAGNMIDAKNLSHLAILIRSKSLNGYIVGARKAATADGDLEVKLLQGGGSSEASGSDEYALVSVPTGWEHGEWKPIPV